jgi:hypothetical protein
VHVTLPLFITCCCCGLIPAALLPCCPAALLPCSLLLPLLLLLLRLCTGGKATSASADSDAATAPRRVSAAGASKLNMVAASSRPRPEIMGMTLGYSRCGDTLAALGGTHCTMLC